MLPYLVGMRTIFMPVNWQTLFAETFPQQIYTSFPIYAHVGTSPPSRFSHSKNRVGKPTNITFQYRREVWKFLNKKHLQLEVAFYYTFNLLQEMKESLKSYPFFDKEMLDRINIPEVYKRDAPYVSKDRIASKAKSHGASYASQILKQAANVPPMEEYDNDVALSLRLATEFSRISWILLELLEDRYKVILDPLFSNQIRPKTPTGKYLN